jgi:hypothetical protein
VGRHSSMSTWVCLWLSPFILSVSSISRLRARWWSISPLSNPWNLFKTCRMRSQRHVSLDWWMKHWRPWGRDSLEVAFSNPRRKRTCLTSGMMHSRNCRTGRICSFR